MWRREGPGPRLGPGPGPGPGLGPRPGPGPGLGPRPGPGSGPYFDDYGGGYGGGSMANIPSMPWGGGFVPPPPPPARVTCSSLRRIDVGKVVEISGKLHRITRERFIQLKDAGGITQLILPAARTDLHRRFAKITLNSYLTVVGEVQARPAGRFNEKLDTGDIEIIVDDVLMVKMHRDKSKLIDQQGTRYGRVISDDGPPKITSEEYNKFHGLGLLQNLKEREYTCGDLASKVNQNVSLTCWVDKASKKFVTLMDGYGKIQCVVPSGRDDITVMADHLKAQNVVVVTGKISNRPETQINNASTNGHIELHIESLEWPIANPQAALTKEEMQEATEDASDVNKLTHRTHTCGELRAAHSGQRVVLCGWLSSRRVSKFLLVRDTYGITQCVIPEKECQMSVDPSTISVESVVKIEGMVAVRPPGMVNEDIATGDVEVIIKNVEVLSNADCSNVQLMLLNSKEKPAEEVRLNHRYIELRSRELQDNLRLRCKILQNIRNFLIEKHMFVEVETPSLLGRPLASGKCLQVLSESCGSNGKYALAESSQLFHQMLMIGGVDRCFQISKSYRDAVSQPELSKLSLEMSFTDGDSMMTLTEQLLCNIFPDLFASPPPFKRVTHKDALQYYGSTEPDLTFDLKFTDLTSVIDNLKKKENVGAFAIAYPKRGRLSNDAFANINKLKLSYPKTTIVVDIKKISPFTLKAIRGIIDAFQDFVMAFGDIEETRNCMAEVRHILAEELKVSSNGTSVGWVTEPPLYEIGPSGQQICKHLFTAPHPEDVGCLDGTKTVRAYAYNLIVNRKKVCEGSVRNIDPDSVKKQLQSANVDELATANVITALKSGCPPHAGISIDIDHLVALACGADNVQQVIAFPRSSKGQDILSATVLVSEENCDDEPSIKCRKIE